MAFNIVELIADQDDSAFDQPCKFGHRVEGHAVYCHHDEWVSGPRKCRRSWYTGGEVRDEDCPGFAPNSKHPNVGTPTTIISPCVSCGGAKVIKPDAAKPQIETCDRCAGNGEEPQFVSLSQDELYVLESLVGPALSHQETREARPVIVSAKSRLTALPDRICDDDWADLESVSFDHGSGVSVYMLRLTAKGFAILRMFWNQQKES